MTRPQISHDRHRLDLPAIIRWVQGSYWGGHMTEAQIKRACHNSMVWGLYLPHYDNPIDQGRVNQIAFARVVSDHSANSIITDVYVDEPYRRQGYGRLLMQAVVEHPSVANTICVLTTRVPEFYLIHGFLPIGGGVLKRDPK